MERGRAAELEGLRSQAMQEALQEALRGRDTSLETLLARHGGMPSPNPNLKLAVAFGAEIGNVAKGALRLLDRLATCDAESDVAHAFLLTAAAYGYGARINFPAESEACWLGLARLAADDRPPARLGAQETLQSLSLQPGGADELVRRATDWIGLDPDIALAKRQREAEDVIGLGAATLGLLVLGQARILPLVKDRAALFALFERALLVIEQAPRSAYRNEEFRRFQDTLPLTLASSLAHLGGTQTETWMHDMCVNAREPWVREVLSNTIVRLRSKGYNQPASMTDRLRIALEGSAKPLRNAARVRPGTGRGKATRKIR